MTLQELLVKIGADVTGFQAGMGKVTKESEAAFKNIERLGDGLTTLGAGLTGTVTLAFAAFGAAAYKAGKDVDEAMDRIRTGTGAVGPQLAQLGESFRNVFANVPVSAQQAGAAVADLNTRLGLTGPALETLATQMLNLSRVTGQELGGIVAATTRLFGDWSVATEKQSETLDYMFRVSQSTGIGITRLTELVVQFGAPLRALGFDLENAAALMGKWEKEGVNLETVLSGLRFALSKFAKAGQEPAEALKQVQQAILGAKNEAQATAIAFENFGKRAAVDMSRAIIEGRFNIDELVRSLKESKETINSAASDTDDFAEKWTLVKNKITLALEPLGRQLLDALGSAADAIAPLTDGIASLVKGFSELPGPVKAVALGLGGIGAAVGPLALVLGTFASNVRNIVGAFQLLGAAGLTLSGTLSALTPLAIAFGAAIAAWAIYEAVTKMQAMEAELNKIYDMQERGIKATQDQIEQIRTLEGIIKQHNSQIGSTPIKVDVGGKSPTEYLKDLKEAVNGIDQFKGKVEGALRPIQTLTVNLKAEHEAMFGTGEAAKTAAGGIRQVGDESDKAAGKHQKHKQAVDELAQAYKTLKFTSMADLLKEVGEAQGAYDKIFAAFQKGKAQVDDVRRAADALEQTWRKVIEAQGLVYVSLEQFNKTSGILQATRDLAELRAQFESVAQQAQYGEEAFNRFAATQPGLHKLFDEFVQMPPVINETGAAVEAVGKKNSEVWDKLGQQVSTIFTDLSKSLADLIFQGGKFGEIMVNVAKDIGKAIVRYIIEEAMGGFIKKIKEAGGLWKALFDMSGPNYGVPTPKVPTPPTTQAPLPTPGGTTPSAPLPTPTAGGSGGWMGYADLIAQAVTAITSVLQYLQGRRMEQDIGRIEVTTRGILNEHLNLRADEWDRETHLMAKLDDIWSSLMHVDQSSFEILRIMQGGGGKTWGESEGEQQAENDQQQALEDLTRATETQTDATQQQTEATTESTETLIGSSKSTAKGFQDVTAAVSTVGTAFTDIDASLQDLSGVFADTGDALSEITKTSDLVTSGMDSLRDQANRLGDQLFTLDGQSYRLVSDFDALIARLGPEGMQQVLDFLAGAMQRATDSVSELGDTITRATMNLGPGTPLDQGSYPHRSYEDWINSLPPYARDYESARKQIADSIDKLQQIFPGRVVGSMMASPVHLPTREEYESWFKIPVRYQNPYTPLDPRGIPPGDFVPTAPTDKYLGNYFDFRGSQLGNELTEERVATMFTRAMRKVGAI